MSVEGPVSGARAAVLSFSLDAQVDPSCGSCPGIIREVGRDVDAVESVVFSP
jgi:hypothetical protein